MSVSDVEETLRRKIMKVLEESDDPLTVEDIASILGLDRSYYKLIYESLSHIAKSIRRLSKGKKILVMRPPYCRNCGYVFKDLRKARKPSRCPRCKSERIAPPAFLIINKK
ncbi:MAG: transcriptional regulator [Thermoprotei archaeon]|nr:transcriptional regulator [Thermoprotei archaeon]